MKITVTQDDIRKARWRMRLPFAYPPRDCMVARALRRHGLRRAKVGLIHVSLDGRTRGCVGPNFPELPLSVTHRIFQFDSGAHVEPFSFWLDVTGTAERFEPPSLVEALRPERGKA